MLSGKQVIHPNQVPVVQNAFSPSEDQVRWARGLVRAFAENQKAGKVCRICSASSVTCTSLHLQGAFEYEGKMIDRPLLLQAQNIIGCHDDASNN